jgi:hypothetical protein
MIEELSHSRGNHVLPDRFYCFNRTISLFFQISSDSEFGCNLFSWDVRATPPLLSLSIHLFTVNHLMDSTILKDSEDARSSHTNQTGHLTYLSWIKVETNIICETQ